MAVWRQLRREELWSAEVTGPRRRCCGAAALCPRASQTPPLRLGASPSPFAAADSTSSTPAMLRLKGKGAPFSGEDGGGGDVSTWGGAWRRQEREGATAPGQRCEWFPGPNARPVGGHSDLSGPKFRPWFRCR
jgi:hypothetical protein